MSVDRIRELNDAFRARLCGGRVVLTPGIDELPPCVKAEVMMQVAEYNQFSPKNDPHGEHDFGSFDVLSRRIFWKIDLYEEPDVKDPNGQPVVNRVLTIMLAGEY